MILPRTSTARTGIGGLIGLLALLAASTESAHSRPTVSGSTSRPNVLWIIVDDMSADFSCYGQTLIATPHVDALAASGWQFNRAFVTAPVCSPCRSALITGMYQTSIGAHHHRSGRGPLKIRLPDNVRPIPELFQEAGYYTTISSWPVKRDQLGKTDYNFQWNRSMYNGADWRQRPSGQPFFAQIQLPGGKLRGGTQRSANRLLDRARQEFGDSTCPQRVVLPPWYPPDPVLLDDWAAYLDSVRFTDQAVGQIVERLKVDQDFDNTVIFFMTDHGISHARGKQFLYDEGIHVPLIITGPGIASGVRDDLVEHIDLAATSLALAAIDIPPSMQSRNLLADGYVAREAVFAARDRCDETVDNIRAVRTMRFKFIRNGMPDRPWLQPNAYKDRKSILITLRQLNAAGQLDARQSRIFAERRPAEELYDLQSDSGETVNLAENPKFQSTLNEMRLRLQDWMEQTGDRGRQPEPSDMYDSDMQVYLGGLRSGNADPSHIRQVEDNIARMRQWAREGR